jgi:hypothetical protein
MLSIVQWLTDTFRLPHFKQKRRAFPPLLEERAEKGECGNNHKERKDHKGKYLMFNNGWN